MKITAAQRAGGLREQRRAPQTGHLVGLYDGIAADMDTTAGRWQTVCEEHGHIISHETYALARLHLADPLGWCETCMAEQGRLEHGLPV
jgi:hypothetical protein